MPALSRDRHLWLALSPHGYGHAAMTAPVVAELRRRCPGLRLTIQTALPFDFLASRYGTDFVHVATIPDFGLCMTSATGVDSDATADAYAALLARWPALLAEEAARLRAARPGLVLANVPPLTIAASAAAGIPVVALSSLNWCDLYAQYCGHRPEAEATVRCLRQAYGAAESFLRCTPAMAMTLPNLEEIGPLASRGCDRRAELRMALRAGEGVRLGLIAFGGFDYRLDLARWPVVPGWMWLSALSAPVPPDRADVVAWQRGGLDFHDLVASVDLVVTKPGYGLYSEAGVCGTAMLTVPRPDWPEAAPFNAWLARHTRCRELAPDALLSPDLAGVLAELFRRPQPQPAEPSGVGEAAAAILRIWAAHGDGCERS